jgi:hypothetical protein
MSKQRKTIKMNVIDIVERFQMHHALQEERELKNSCASRNGTSARSATTKNGIGENILFECEEVRISTVTLPRDTEWSPPHDGRDRLVARLGQIDHPLSRGSDPAFFGRWTWVPANGDFKVVNETDETRHVMIVAFHDLDPVWSYEEPFPAVAQIRGHVAFYPDRVDDIAEQLPTARESSKSGLLKFGE